jgi:hypothetical protein
MQTHEILPIEGVLTIANGRTIQQVVIAQEETKQFVLSSAHFLQIALLHELSLHGRQLGHHPLIGVIVGARHN